MKPFGYVAIVVAAMIAAFAYALRTDGIFACSASGYEHNVYLAYCNSAAYGDYDHGAFWFGLEPETRRRATAADVLFLGSSRMQMGFSTRATQEWFDGIGRSFYLLGFTYTENAVFAGALLPKLAPTASAYVINADGFFDDRVTPPTAELVDDGAASRHRRKRLWQYPHKALCGAFLALCGHQLSFFRKRENGSWTFVGDDPSMEPASIADAPAADQDLLGKRIALAEALLQSLPVQRRCVFFTAIPWARTPSAEAAAIADAIGVKLVLPPTQDLRTFDGSHLDRPSAERWSADFFAAIDSDIRACLEPRLSNVP
jgi:hypothetical protein